MLRRAAEPASRTVSSAAPAVRAARTCARASRTARAVASPLPSSAASPQREKETRPGAAGTTATGAAGVRRMTRRRGQEAVAFADVVMDHAKTFHGGAHDGFVTDQRVASLPPRDEMRDQLISGGRFTRLREPRGAFYDSDPWYACLFTSSTRLMSIDSWPGIPLYRTALHARLRGFDDAEAPLAAPVPRGHRGRKAGDVRAPASSPR